MLLSPNYTQALHHCPFMETTSHEWIYIGPVLLVLATNAFFLVSIFYVVVAKLRSTGQRESSDHQNWRAAKALLVIIPLLGITYLITILPPLSPQSVAYPVFAHFRAILLSTQGFMVSLPYCFLNTEVKGILQHHWKRWRNTRYVGIRNTLLGNTAWGHNMIYELEDTAGHRKPLLATSSGG